MTSEELDRLWRDRKNWRWTIYRCPEDPRVIVPKRIPWTGYTLNFAHRMAIPVLLGMMVFMMAPLLFLFSGSAPQNTYRIMTSFVVVVAIVLVFSHWESTRDRG